MRVAAALCAAFLLLAPLPARAELSVTMHDGLVTVQATDVTVRQILEEWARVGQAKIVNVEGLTGGPVTLQLTNVPEAQALDILLRSAAGYLAAPRATPLPNAAHFDRVIVMPTSSPSRESAPPRTSAPPVVRAPAPFRPVPADGDDGPPPAPPFAPQVLPNQPGGPVFNTFPAVAPPPQAEPPAPFATATPGAPSGVSAPGMVIPPPQPVQPGQVPPQDR